MCEKPSKYVNFHLDVPFAGVQKQILSKFSKFFQHFQKIKSFEFFLHASRVRMQEHVAIHGIWVWMREIP